MSYVTYPTYVLPNDLNVNSVTASNGFTGSFIGDGAGLYNIPTSSINNINEFATLTGVSGTFVSQSQLAPYATLTGVSGTFVSQSQLADYATLTGVSGTFVSQSQLADYATLTGVSGTFVTNTAATASLAFLTASNTFTAVNTFQSAVTGTSAYLSGDLYVNGTASIAVLNTVEQQSLKIGDKYITILSGASSQAEMDGAGILFGSGSSDTPKGEQDSVAHIIYRNGNDQIEVFPGLKVSGSLTASAASSFTEATASVGFSGGSFAGTSFSGSSTLSVGGLSTFGGSVIVPMRTATASDSISATTDYIVAFSGSNLTASLPSAAGVNGVSLIVKNTHTSPLFITSSVSTIDGGPSVTISTQYNSYTFVSDNTNWLIV